jgi:hypothetical protein
VLLTQYEKEKVKAIFEYHNLSDDVLYIENDDDNTIRHVIPLEPLIKLVLESEPDQISWVYKTLMKNQYDKEHVTLCLASIHYQLNDDN